MGGAGVAPVRESGRRGGVAALRLNVGALITDGAAISSASPGVGDVPTKAAGPATLSTVCVVVVGVVARAGRSALLEVVHAAARALQGADGKCVAPRPSLYRIQSISRVARTQSTLLQQGTPSGTDTNVHRHIMQVINTHSTSPTRNTAAPREVVLILPSPGRVIANSVPPTVGPGSASGAVLLVDPVVGASSRSADAVVDAAVVAATDLHRFFLDPRLRGAPPEGLKPSGGVPNDTPLLRVCDVPQPPLQLLLVQDMSLLTARCACAQ